MWLRLKGLSVPVVHSNSGPEFFSKVFFALQKCDTMSWLVFPPNFPPSDSAALLPH
jgi:hypothetical protein